MERGIQFRIGTKESALHGASCVPHRFAAIIRRVPLMRPCLEAPNDEILHEMRIDKKNLVMESSSEIYLDIWISRIIF